MAKARRFRKTTIVRGRKQEPVEYKVKIGLELVGLGGSGSESEGIRTKFELELPIRKGAGDRLGKYKKEDVAAMIRQLADVIQSGDPTMFTELSKHGMKVGVKKPNGKGKANEAN